MGKLYLATLCGIIVLMACKKMSTLPTEDLPLPGTPAITTKNLLSGRGIIWGFDSLPNGNIIFSEKAGGLFLLDTATLSVTSISGLPTNVVSGGQGGWLDVCTSPQFSNNNIIYVTYSITGNFLQLARFTLSGTVANNWQILQTTNTASSWQGHYGSRICFGPDGKLYWSVGEGGNGSYGGASSPHQNAQLLNSYWGKIHRLNADGSIPTDNPLYASTTSLKSIYSYGHRNPQGLCIQPGTGRMYSTEHGPQGGCELNLIEPSKNYGWPLYSNGINYDGTPISNGHSAAGITAPLMSFTPALAPGGCTFINHNSFRDWKGNLLLSSLGRQHIVMITLNVDGLPIRDTVLFNGIGRVRNIKPIHNGKILFSVDDGRLIEMKGE